MVGKKLCTCLTLLIVALLISVVANKQVSAQEEMVTVAAGASLMIETQSELNSKKHGAGHRFQAVLVGDLVSADGKVVAPNGSMVFGILSAAKKSGRVVGKASLIIEFDSIMVNNRRIPIATSQVQAATDGTTKKSAGQVVRGAAIGGLIDGKKGARTGAKVGAGAAIVTGGNQINVPGGTLLEIQLREAAHFPKGQ